MLLFLSAFGTGGQASQAINNSYGVLIIFIPLLVTIFLGYKLFSKKKIN